MTSYLQRGWYADEADRTRLRTEVIDGAMDVAGMLLRAGVPAHRILRVALKVRLRGDLPAILPEISTR